MGKRLGEDCEAGGEALVKLKFRILGYPVCMCALKILHLLYCHLAILNKVYQDISNM